MKIGERIKRRRVGLKMSADELARRIGKDRSTVYRYESGDIDKVSVEMLWPLARALETSPAYLIGLDGSSGEIASAHVEDNGIIAHYVSTNATQVRHMEQWIRELGHVEMTDDENDEIIKFAKYLIYRRNFEK